MHPVQIVFRTLTTKPKGAFASLSYSRVPGCRWAATSSENGLTERVAPSHYPEMECAWLLDRLGTPQEVAMGGVANTGQDVQASTSGMAVTGRVSGST